MAEVTQVVAILAEVTQAAAIPEAGEPAVATLVADIPAGATLAVGAVEAAIPILLAAVAGEAHMATPTASK